MAYWKSSIPQQKIHSVSDRQLPMNVVPLKYWSWTKRRDTKPHNGLIVPKTWVFDNDTTGAPMPQSIIQVVHGTRMLNEAPRQVSRCWTSRIVLRYMALKPYTCSSVSSFRWLRDAAGQHVRTPTREKCEIFPPPPPGVASRNLNWMSKRCIGVLPHRSRRNQGVTARAKGYPDKF